MDNYEKKLITKAELKKIQIRKTAGICSFLMLLFGMLSMMFSFSISAVLLFLSKNNINVQYIIQGEFFNIVTGIMPCIIFDIIVITVGLKVNNIRIKRSIFSEEKYSKRIILEGMFSCGGIILISSILNSIYTIITNIFNITTPAPDFSFPQNNYLRIIYIIYVCILGPILEEILFRGIIFNTLKQNGIIAAGLFSSILFAMFHLNLVQFITPLLLGALLALLVVKTNSIIPSIIVHMFNNSMALILNFIIDIDKNLYIFLMLVYLLLGIIVFNIFIIKQYNIMIKLKKESNVLSIKKQLKCCIFNKWSIIYLVFYLFVIISNFLLENI